jgi:hypothetical protein
VPDQRAQAGNSPDTLSTGKKRPRKPLMSSPAVIARNERAQRAVDMRRAGVSFDAIARALGYASSGHAHTAFMTYMREYPRESIDDARQVELDRLDQLQAAIWQQCLASGSSNQHWAIDRMLKISDQRARLLGLNAPVRQEVSVITESTVDRAISDLQAQLEAQAAAAGVALPALPV